MARRARSLETLLAEVNARHAQRDTGSDGWIGDAAHRSRPSDHNPNTAGVVRAQDFDADVDPGDRELSPELWDFLLASRDRRISYVISRARMFSSYPVRGYPSWTPRPYSGSNGHFTHLHLSVVADPALYDDGRPWGFASGATEEDDMLRHGQTDPAVTQWQHTLNRYLKHARISFAGDGLVYDQGRMLKTDGSFGDLTRDATAAVTDHAQRHAEALGHPIYSDPANVTAVTQAYVVAALERLLHPTSTAVTTHHHDDRYASTSHGHQAVVTVR